MAESIASILMENLEELMSCRRDLITGEEDKISWLYKELQLLIAFLEDLQIKFYEHEGAKNLEARIRDVVYEAETAVDLFVVNTFLKEEKEEEMMKKKIKDGKGKMMKMVLNLGHVKKEIEAIKTEVMCYSAVDIVNIGGDVLLPRGGNTSSHSQWKEETLMVGFEEEAMMLKEQLTGGSRQLEVISIVGMAGLGKTTLATNLYNDDLVRYYFYMRAWVSVSQEYKKRDLLLGLLSCVLQRKNDDDEELAQKWSNDDDEVLAQELYKSLKGRRYLIVMDDIWDHRAWFDVNNCFPNDNNGSRILFTSRHEHVALLSKLRSCPPPLSLRFLSHDESWNLLRQKIFQNETCPSELVEIGKQIAQKCRGLPLAIVVVAGILANGEKSQERWKQIWRTLDSQLATADLELWTKAIALSYNHLPQHLKPCFLYFVIFPEDSQIPVHKLIWLWVAEGFIRRKIDQEKSLEDVAEEYLMDLIGRSLVLISNRGYDDQIKSCGIHDLLREFCLQKAKEEYFLRRWIMGDQLVPSPYPSSSSSIFNHTCLPSFCIGNRDFPRLLRVLKYDRFPQHMIYSYGEIGRLVLLRYLDLSSERFGAPILPASISRLWNLETLILRSTVIQLPHSIRKLVKLRHIYLGKSSTCSIESPDSDVDYPSSMDNLQTLLCIDPWSWTDVLCRSPNLRKLGVRIPFLRDYESSPFLALDYLNHVQNLKISLEDISFERITFPPNLKKLTLIDANLDSADMSSLAKLLPNLEALKLSWCFFAAYGGRVWETSGVFPKLKFLKFTSLSIKRWIASSYHFPSLERLVLYRCYGLKNIPSGIGNILTLKTIEVHSCNTSLANSARLIKEEQETLGNNGLQIIDYSKNLQVSPGFGTNQLPKFLRNSSKLSTHSEGVIDQARSSRSLSDYGGFSNSFSSF